MSRYKLGVTPNRRSNAWLIHLDADCLDDVIMPAVDFRVPGVSWDELGAALRVALASGKAVGLEITIYNPRLDEDGSAGRGLADLLAAVLRTATLPPSNS